MQKLIWVGGGTLALVVILVLSSGIPRIPRAGDSNPPIPPPPQGDALAD